METPKSVSAFVSSSRCNRGDSCRRNNHLIFLVLETDIPTGGSQGRLAGGERGEDILGIPGVGIKSDLGHQPRPIEKIRKGRRKRAGTFITYYIRFWEYRQPVTCARDYQSYPVHEDNMTSQTATTDSGELGGYSTKNLAFVTIALPESSPDSLMCLQSCECSLDGFPQEPVISRPRLRPRERPKDWNSRSRGR